MQKVEQSMLAPAVLEARVIPNGVDLSIFHRIDRGAARTALGMPQDAKVLLFTGHFTRGNPWKDFQTLRAAVTLLAERQRGHDILFIAVGEEARSEQSGRAKVHFIPHQKDPQTVARYYQASDLYIHAAKADTFPLTVLEALACSTPVVATAVGGIPEQVKGLKDFAGTMADVNCYGLNEATGILAPPGDANGMTFGIERLLNDDALSRRISENAAQDARERFDLQRQVNQYLEWYRELLQNAVPQRKTDALAPQ
jgi:glycosyltransferase involved in cell wall biosynthesis